MSNNHEAFAYRILCIHAESNPGGIVVCIGTEDLLLLATAKSEKRKA